MSFLKPVTSFALCFLVFLPSSYAVLDLHVEEDLPVYAQPRKGAKLISKLAKGDRVVISPKRYGSYRKVLVTYNSARVAGFVEDENLKKSYITDRDDEGKSDPGSSPYRKHYGLGLSLATSYLRQGERTITTSVGDNYDISSLNSFSFFFAAFLDVPVANQWVLRPYLALRSTSFSGAASLRNSINPIGTPTAEVDQSLLGLGVVVKRYPWTELGFWYGGAAEVAKASSVKVIVSDQIPYQASDQSLPVFIVTEGAVGWDIPTIDNIYFTPEARIGGIFNTKPMTIAVEVFFAFGYPL